MPEDLGCGNLFLCDVERGGIHAREWTHQRQAVAPGIALMKWIGYHTMRSGIDFSKFDRSIGIGVALQNFS